MNTTAIYFALVFLIALVSCLVAPPSVSLIALWALACLVWLRFVAKYARAHHKSPFSSVEMEAMRSLHRRLKLADQAWTRAWHERLFKQTVVETLQQEQEALLTFIERAQDLEAQGEQAGKRLLNALLADIKETRLPEANYQLLQAQCNISPTLAEMRNAVAAAKQSALAARSRKKPGEVAAFQTAILHAEGVLDIGANSVS